MSMSSTSLWHRPAPSARLAILLAHLALIFFSSTRIAGQWAEYAFRFYRSLLGRVATGAEMHLLAQKGVHFLLFFSLGVWTHNTLNGTRAQKLVWAVCCCVLAGALSESVQLFTGRDAALADVLLNGASGALGAALAWRCSAARLAGFSQLLTQPEQEVRTGVEEQPQEQ